MYSSSCYSWLIFHIVPMSLMVVTFTPWPLYPRYQLSRIVCGFHFIFACFLQYKILLPQSDIELSSLAVPTHSPVTVLRLPQLNRSNGRTALIFQIVLIAQGRSWWGQQQLLTCVLFRSLNLVLEIQSENLVTNMFDFLLLFCAYILYC
jgi:hypothetical protein